MAITDQTILSEIQRVTVENTGDLGATWPSGMWTQAEVLDALNGRQERLIAETRLFWAVREDAITINQRDQAIPAAARWAATVLVAFKTAAGLYRELLKLSALEIDYATPAWPSQTGASPRGYYELEGNTLTTYVIPTPTEAGSILERYFVQLGTTLDATGIAFAVSDEFVPTVKYGTLADLFSKIGPAQNPTLAAICEERWQEGLEMGKLIAQEGWFAL